MKQLTREEMKNLSGGLLGDDDGGGGTCCAHSASWDWYICDISKSAAQAYASQYAQGSGQHGYWCCESC